MDGPGLTEIVSKLSSNLDPVWSSGVNYILYSNENDLYKYGIGCVIAVRNCIEKPYRACKL